MGLRDQETEGVYKFLDGSYPEWSDWWGQEPDGMRVENCAQMLFGNGWYDGWCDVIQYPYVCERLIGRQVLLT